MRRQRDVATNTSTAECVISRQQAPPSSALFFKSQCRIPNAPADAHLAAPPQAIAGKIARKKDQIAKAELQARVKEDLKTVALGTSKINYMDPRITIAWCKRNEVPLEKVFNKSLLGKFHWCMEEEPEFRF